MKANVFLSSIILSIPLITGCMSIQEQLASTNPAVRAVGESRLERIIFDTNEWNGGATKEERIAAIKMATNQELLLKVLTIDILDTCSEYWYSQFQTPEIYEPAIDRLDDDGLLKYIHLANDNDRDKALYAVSKIADIRNIIKAYEFSSPMIRKELLGRLAKQLKLITDQYMLADILLKCHEDLSASDKTAIVGKISDSASLAGILLRCHKNLSASDKTAIVGKISDSASLAGILLKCHKNLSASDKAAIVGKISNQAELIDILLSCRDELLEGDKLMIVGKITDSKKLVELATKDIDSCDVKKWNGMLGGAGLPFSDTIFIASIINNPSGVEEIASSIITSIP